MGYYELAYYVDYGSIGFTISSWGHQIFSKPMSEETKESLKKSLARMGLIENEDHT